MKFFKQQAVLSFVLSEEPGPKRFLFGGHEFMRTDLQVQNCKGRRAG
jgi:hypothetical protein